MVKWGKGGDGFIFHTQPPPLDVDSPIPFVSTQIQSSKEVPKSNRQKKFEFTFGFFLENYIIIRTDDRENIFIPKAKYF